MFERLKKWLGLSRKPWTTQDYHNAFYRDDPDIQGYMEDFEPPTRQQRHLMELGLTRCAGGMQSYVGFFSRHTTRTKMATEILEILSAALAAEGIKIDFGSVEKGYAEDKEIEIDTFHLERIVGSYFLSISVRIDQENHNRNCNGFVPEERDGGFGILVRVTMGSPHHRMRSDKQVRWSNSDEFCKEIFNSSHLTDPDCDLEIAVAEIKRITKGLTPRKQ